MPIRPTDPIKGSLVQAAEQYVIAQAQVEQYTKKLNDAKKVLTDALNDTANSDKLVAVTKKTLSLEVPVPSLDKTISIEKTSVESSRLVENHLDILRRKVGILPMRKYIVVKEELTPEALNTLVINGELTAEDIKELHTTTSSTRVSVKVKK